jgi:hypothetical protein
MMHGTVGAKRTGVCLDIRGYHSVPTFKAPWGEIVPGVSFPPEKNVYIQSKGSEEESAGPMRTRESSPRGLFF